MIKVKNVSEALAGDFINYNQKLSVVASIVHDQNRVIIRFDDGVEKEFSATARVEIFRIIDRESSF
jgi:hypothetical protein